MLPFNDSISQNSHHSLGNQQAYRELIHHLSQFFSEETLTERLNVEQMFILVDGVLPIEACLYYQVLPLFLDGSRLHLGMVNPEETTASDYVRRIVSYLNYSLITRRISSQALQAALSAYLKYSDSQSPSSHQPSTAAPEPSPFLTDGEDSQVGHSNSPHNLETNNRETLVLDATEQLDLSEMIANAQGIATPGEEDATESDPPPILPADELTCIDPEKTEIIRFDSTADDIQTQMLSPDDLLDTDERIATDEDMIVTPPSHPPQPTSLDQNNRLSSSPSGIGVPVPEIQRSELAENIHPISANSSQTTRTIPAPNYDLSGVGEEGSDLYESVKPPLSIQVESGHMDRSLDDLAMLPPRELLKELLARSMSGGIGRLYFERKPEYGRILWSQSGILQAAVNAIIPDKFQALINEFKRLTRLPLLPLRNTKQVELERFYQGNRVLLRFRFIPGKHGEQATLQVLRGAALTFYQQQQVTRIGQDAVSIAKRLQTKISELKARLDAYPRLSNPAQASLPELKQMLLNLENQVDALSIEIPEFPPKT